ncbi:cypD [Scenedesmus sp. PABB004]|nr:cypD [Scenedesmus sp. PABB004]
MAPQAPGRGLGLALGAAAGAALVGAVAWRATRPARRHAIVVLLDGPAGPAKRGLALSHERGAPLEALLGAVAAKAQLQRGALVLHGSASKAPLPPGGALDAALDAEAAAAGGTAVLLATTAPGGLSAAARAARPLSAPPWAPRWDDFVKMWDRQQQLAVQRISDNGLFTSSTTHPDWQTGRGLLARGFNTLKLSSYWGLVLAKARGFMQEWARFPPGSVVVDVNEWLAAMASDAVVFAATGWDMRNLERKGCGDAVHPFLSAFKFGLRFALGLISPVEALGGWGPVLNPLTSTRRAMEAKFAAARKVCEDMVEMMCEATRRGELGGGARSVLSSLLCDVSPSSGQYVRQRCVYGHMINLLVAGHETTAASLGFLIYYLAANPQWEDAVRAEARAVLGGRGELRLEDLPRLVTAEACFREVLRLHPPVALVNRDAAAPVSLASRWLLQRGQRVAVLLAALHRDEATWGGRFGDVNAFNPDRFMPGADAGRHPCAYLPWGMGVRACIGQSFALMEAKAWIVAVYDRFTLRLPPGFVFKPSHVEGGAAPVLEGLAVQVLPAPGARLPPPVARAPGLFGAAPGGSGSAPCSRAGSFTRHSSLPPDGAEPPSTVAALAAANGDGAPSSPLRGAAAAAAVAAAAQLFDAPPGSPPRAAVSGGGAAAAAAEAGGRLGTPLLVLYGSNAGTCEAFADLLAARRRRRRRRRRRLAAPGGAAAVGGGEAAPLAAALPGAGAVAVIASTYNGHPPDNAARFAAWLDAAAAAGAGAGGVTYAVFGVGDSKWETFQAFAKRVDARLAAAGGSRLRGLAGVDVSGAGFAEAFETWQADLVAELLVHFNVPQLDGALGAAPDGGARGKQRVILELLPDTHPGAALETVVPQLQAMRGRGISVDGLPLDFTAHLLRVTAARQLQAADSGRFTRHVELALPPGMTYVAGAHLEVTPANSPHIVDFALGLLGLKGDEAVRWTPSAAQDSACTPCSFVSSSRQALTFLAELSATPTRRQVAWLASACPCPPEAAALWELAGEAGYKDAVLARRVTSLELLAAHTSLLAVLDLPALLNFLPRLKPRYYSISSSPRTAPNRVCITVARVDFTTPTGRLHRGPGSCTCHDVEVGQFVLGTVSDLQSAFRLPADLRVPVVMVGGGTGVAPFVAFLEERDAARRAGEALGPAHLFFGCRSPRDFIYRERLEAWRQSGVLSGLHVAFSREGPCKVYVQDLIRQQAAALWELLDGGRGVVFVCGDARRMAPGVASAFCDVARDAGGRSDGSASAWLGSLREAGRYLEDVWC